MDPDDEALEATLGRAARRSVGSGSTRTVERLRELGLPVDDRRGELDPADDVARAADDRPRCSRPKGHVTSVEDGSPGCSAGAGRRTSRARGSARVSAIEAIRGAGGLAVLAHFSEAPGRAMPSCASCAATGLGGLEVYYRTFDRATVAAVGAVARRAPARATGGSDYHGDTARTPRRTPQLWVPPEVGERAPTPRSARGRATDDRIDDPPDEPPAADARHRPAGRRRRPPRDARRPRRRPARRVPPGSAALPAFHVWTLGCQMNRSDSEEMAGRLLAAGCAEAPSMEAADLVVINTCAIREGAEQKVIGRQGHLAPAEGARTRGCASS